MTLVHGDSISINKNNNKEQEEKKTVTTVVALPETKSDSYFISTETSNLKKDGSNQEPSSSSKLDVDKVHDELRELIVECGTAYKASWYSDDATFRRYLDLKQKIEEMREIFIKLKEQ